MLIGISDPFTKEGVAEWTELVLMLEERSVSKEELKSLINKAGNPAGEEIEEEIGEKLSDEIKINAFISTVWDELKYRNRLYGISPPYAIDDSVVSPNLKWSNRPAYMMCLLLSFFGIDTKKDGKFGKLFERLSNEAVKNYLGGRSLVVGFPREKHITMQYIANEIKERFGKPLPTDFNEAGLDVLAWKNFDDRPNKLILFVQSAAGKDWKSKMNEIDLHIWRDTICWACDPVKGLTTPFILTEDQLYNHSKGGLILDRPRIYTSTNSARLKNKELENDIRKWCQGKLKRMVYA